MGRFAEHAQQGGSVIVTSHQALPGLNGQIKTVRLHAMEWQ